ncbi:MULTISPECIES: glycosyltransferase family 4 protein [unclassified Shinella]|uniref:glycosyltransferase family 4 protein n=1 Tax=unclassified Shinella TaxID=2643062 RepID=UPI0006811B84|nr:MULTISPECIES: glycosyltransferase family 4 protein [unclassified Shinella]MCO5151057.1 glycosyltransferase family 4 protein [Shinella sp.]MDC7265906.1 glycosyltransferase family 4 protein [Shinella sp. HY16]MDC7272803.1 glycosyltransferase family 4 protein [Shinella sp. YZ44]TAA64308.1 glycosyltransferase WbuB [Shinella sp. JR1-6]
MDTTLSASETASISGNTEIAGALKGRKILIIVENLPVPFDRRVWQEARTLHAAGAQVAIICPTGKGYTARYEQLDGIHIYRHPLPLDAGGALGYLLEYGAALTWETLLSWKILFRHGFDTLHGCNPPDLIFLIAWQFKLLGKRYIFDHHDINPELYEAKFNKRGFFWRLMCAFEWLTFKTADTVISTNESYKKIALERGGKKPEDIFVVRSGPDLSRVKAVAPNLDLKNGRDFLIGYVGVMGDQEGIDLLLEAARHLVFERGRQDIQFTLVGGGPSLAALQALSEKMGLKDYVTFTGRAPDQTLFEVLSTADVCVNPDRVNPMNDKSTMNKILEYMAVGKPIVQFDVTEGRFSAREASLYAKPNDPIDFADKLAELLADPALRAEMGAFGRHRVETQMAWSYEIPKLIAAYKNVRP